MHIRCSGLARPMICAGFKYLDLPRPIDKGYGDEGTAAGEYLQNMLEGITGKTVASNGYCFDDDMKFFLTPIYNDILSRAANPREIYCEQRIDWDTTAGILIKGRYDIAFIDKNNRLCVEDLKYGWGLVEVEENWQLIAYAIGEVLRRGVRFEEVSLKIHQPRPHHEKGSTREWVISYDQLLEYKVRIEKRMQTLVDGNREFRTSKHCKYCLGSGEACPAFNRLFYRSLEVTTEFFQDSIDNDELAAQLDQIKRAEEVLKIKKDSLEDLGNLRIRDGQVVPGYVQTQSFTNRVWKKGISPEAIAMMTGKDVIEKTFMSPAKAEKMDIAKELVEQLTERRSKGFKLKKQDTTKLGNEIFGTGGTK